MSVGQKSAILQKRKLGKMLKLTCKLKNIKEFYLKLIAAHKVNSFAGVKYFFGVIIFEK